ncbi:hypothetical protein GUITHDRAFT_131614 [Guillardia theta CCMP2712]|uniref:Uncharacterized protein n=1 Tax=Guillardia theta (strain CCMP2712) TaxID=905079 RepID=L1K484_GUITC|nr:hypothetical protein GUITHDRAFT_131614 [Guillardia theta CCMP2712]EKX55409.1 hypothetical protein GUITHDRAFT_131614 [Guillardia theta CCMP2712]|eukprot:XP_005842389.1 hypothetical protein GUITHDRAFT_131614 [Guillardia theta CCMP2712]
MISLTPISASPIQVPYHLLHDLTVVRPPKVKIADHIQNLAATWNNPIASTFAIKISSADSVPALLNAIDLILCSQENLYRKSNDVCPADSYDTMEEDSDPLSRFNDLEDLVSDGDNLPQFLVEDKGYDQELKKRRKRKTMDQALTIAAAMTCLRLSDVICHGLLPQIEKGLETLSFPLGTDFSSLFPARKILTNIGDLRKSSDLYSLEKAVCQHWPDVLLIGTTAIVMKTSASSRSFFKSVSAWKDTASEAVSNVVQENLREPMKAISKLLFEKPAGNEMQEAVERSRQALQRMIDVAAERSFYKDELKRTSAGGMEGIMKTFELEMRSPIKGALTGKLLRAVSKTLERRNGEELRGRQGLIQLQEMKLNFETEMTTVLAMLPVLSAIAIATAGVSGAISWIGSRNQRTREDLLDIVHEVNKCLISEQVGGTETFRSMGLRCLFVWQMGKVLQTGIRDIDPRQVSKLRNDVVKLASPAISVQEHFLQLDLVYRQLSRA